jgi:prophage DNA circulation protein
MPVASASIFEDLREFSWRSIGFPVSGTRFSFRQDHAEHKWPDRDGAHIEATGRSPLQIEARIPLRNGIAPGHNETWTGPLYPTVFRTLLAALLDRTTGDLNHPELGVIACKCESADVSWDPGRRDGVDVDVRWIESTDSADSLIQTIAGKSPITTAIQFGADLDLQISQLPTIPQTPPTLPSFGDSMRSIQAIGDQAALASMRVSGVINNVLYRVQNVEDAATRLKSSQSWPVINSCERLKASINDLKRTLLVATKSIRFYITPGIVTLAQICVATNSKIADVLALNPQLAAKVTVDAQTLVRYYG